MYLALYRKYRPKTFEDVLSQPHITKTLRNEIQSGKTAHAYLFTGPRGTGKTTCAKILSMAVNCENPQNGDPCFQCASCKAIENNATMDIVEIDAASNSGVDNIRDLKDEASYLPSVCKYRVYIIDEAHMLSIGAFNALLKIMEEPPEHVKFILATTEAHKIPATILSRCQRFDFRRIQVSDIKARLLQVAELEKLTLAEDAADLLARLADGGMRDALSLLDRCAGFSSEITLDSAIQTIGLVDRDYLFNLTDCVLRQDAASAIQQVDRLYSMSKDMQSLLEEWLTHFRNLMLLKTLKNPDDLILALPDEMARLKEYAQKLPLPVILYTMGELRNCIDRMNRSFDRRMAVELCVVKLCTPSMNTSNDALAARIARLEAATVSGGTAEKQKAVAAPQSAKSSVPPAKKALENQMGEAPAEQPVAQNEPGIFEKKTASSGEEDGIVPLDSWNEILSELSKTDMPLYGVLKESRAFVGGGILYIDSLLSITSRMIKQKENAKRLIAAVESVTGIHYRIRVKSAPPKAEEQDQKLGNLLERAKQHGVEVIEK